MSDSKDTSGSSFSFFASSIVLIRENFSYANALETLSRLEKPFISPILEFFMTSVTYNRMRH